MYMYILKYVPRVWSAVHSRTHAHMCASARIQLSIVNGLMFWCCNARKRPTPQTYSCTAVHVRISAKYKYISDQINQEVTCLCICICIRIYVYLQCAVTISPPAQYAHQYTPINIAYRLLLKRPKFITAYHVILYGIRSRVTSSPPLVAVCVFFSIFLESDTIRDHDANIHV